MSIAVTNAPTNVATIPFQQEAPITRYEIVPPSGAIASIPKIMLKAPPTAAPVMQQKINITGLIATYGIAPSVMPDKPIKKFATEGTLSASVNF